MRFHASLEGGAARYEGFRGLVQHLSTSLEGLSTLTFVSIECEKRETLGAYMGPSAAAKSHRIIDIDPLP